MVDHMVTIWSPHGQLHGHHMVDHVVTMNGTSWCVKTGLVGQGITFCDQMWGFGFGFVFGYLGPLEEGRPQPFPGGAYEDFPHTTRGELGALYFWSSGGRRGSYRQYGNLRILAAGPNRTPPLY